MPMSRQRYQQTVAAMRAKYARFRCDCGQCRECVRRWRKKVWKYHRDEQRDKLAA
jgi:hypothetical protein